MVTPEARAVFWTNLLSTGGAQAEDEMYEMIAQQMIHRGMENKFYFDMNADGNGDWFAAQVDAAEYFGTQMEPKNQYLPGEALLKVCYSQALAEAALHEVSTLLP